MASDRDFVALHREALVIDSHNDTIVSHIRRGNLGLDGVPVKDATEFPRITEGLLRRGYSAGDVRKILGENHLRVLRDAIG